MPRKNLLHVGEHLVRVNRFLDCLIEGKHISLPGAYKDEAIGIRFINKAILRSHAAKGTRKDVYVHTVKDGRA